MKRQRFSAALLCILLLLLCGCGNDPTARLKERQTAFRSAQTLRLMAEVTALVDGERFACTLDCSRREGETVVEVTAPETIAGIRARIRDGETALEYDGISLGIGTAGTTGLTPVSALPLLLDALCAGTVLRCGRERESDREQLAAEIYITEDATLTVWFDGTTLEPTAAEYSCDGQVVIQCAIRSFSAE